ncbi:uncharacterized protein SOCE26_061430 [Sorangium cellulosum]|uniref:PNPLA domain-containing protein n=1 Tax=Sorangium cellulosum TaxID=56 RepID=A0A2L0EZH7_SORCE|nr:patatin-like phospholipase family protein [Sorangium cellulosum]AUX44676.1 uncharacterized protein SOCE26_061430 [Sorangium cellulosum]
MDEHDGYRRDECSAGADEPGSGAERRGERSLLSPCEVCAPPPRPAREERRAPERLNLVFEAGGLLGHAEVGAVAALAQALLYNERYKDTYISYLAGTSAGAIIAVLLGAGYNHSEIADIFRDVMGAELAEYAKLSTFRRVRWYADTARGIFTRLGMSAGKHFSARLRDALRAKRVRTFGDLLMPGCEREEDPSRKYRVHVIASDITRGRMLVLPDDINTELYGVEPDDLDVAQAVMMSSSYPPVLSPVRLRGANGVESYIADGALTSAFPIHLFDAGAPQGPERLTLGIRVSAERYNEVKFPSFYHWLKAAFVTAFSARDVSETLKRVDKLKWARAIQINTGDASMFALWMSPLKVEELYNAGYSAMRRAIDTNVLERATAVQEAAEGVERDVAGLRAP